MISQNPVVQSIYDATWGRVFAGAYDRFLRRAESGGLAEQRRALVSRARGRTLEIATGTGLNLPHYGDAVTQLVLTEPYPHMLRVLRNKVSGFRRPVKVMEAVAERLPFPDESFDTVVATMILCSAESPERVLAEIARVLKPDGRYLFLEHVRNPDGAVARRQDRLQPLWYLFGNGCHCNRDTVSTLRGAPFVIDELEYGQIPHAWSIVEVMVTGSAAPLAPAAREAFANRCCPACA